MLKARDFAVAMELAIAGRVQELGAGCSQELAVLLERLVLSQQAFVLQLADTSSKDDAGNALEFDVARLIGSDDERAAITSRFQPGTVPVAVDIVIIWSICSMLDKMGQFYLQAAKQVDSTQERLVFSSLAEVKQKLRRRVAGVEQIQSNQVWKGVGFPPGLLGKD